MAAAWNRQFRKCTAIGIGCGLWSCLAASPSTIAVAETTVIDDDADGVLYFGDWASETALAAREGSFHSANSSGASMSVEFFGEFARVLGTTGPGYGKAQVRLCSSDEMNCEWAELDEHSKILQHDQVVFARYGLPAARYRLEIQVSDASSGNVSVDGIAFGTALHGTRYVDSRSDKCSNTNSAELPDAPWCDFTHLNGETLAPGAQLRLARGGVWSQQLGKLYGEGTADDWITVDAYGDGPPPAIRLSRSLTDRAIWLDNPSHWRISNLDISNAAAGIVAYYTTNGHIGLRLDHLSTHDNDVVHYRSADDWAPAADLPGMYHGAAIFITGNVPITDNAAAISDIEISNIDSSHDSDPLDIAGFNPSPGRLNFLSTDLGHHAVRDVRIHNVTFHDAKGAPNFDNVETLRLFSSRLTRMCTEHQEIGTTSLFLWSAADVTIANNVISDLPYTGSPDGTGTDLESVSSNARFRGNWYLNNAGAGIEILAARGATDFQLEHEISGNVFYQNGLAAGEFPIDGSDSAATVNYTQESSLFLLNQTGKSEAVTGRAQDNLLFEPNGFIASEPLGYYSWQLARNQNVSARSLFDARVDLGGMQATLRSEFFDGNIRRALRTAEEGERFEAGTGFVTAFDMLPPACTSCAIARRWTAPYEGTISVRGWAMKTAVGGDGVMLRITKNGSQVWPREPGWHVLDSSDPEGVPAYLDDLAIEQTDALRFEVAAGANGDARADLVSWSPTIAYTRRTRTDLLVVQDGDIGSGTNQVRFSNADWSERSGIHETRDSDATLSIGFEGAQVTVHGPRGPEQGAAAFTLCLMNSERCLDEAIVTLFDTGYRADQVLWTSPVLPIGSYRLRLRAVPAAEGTGDRVSFDYATISSNPQFINNDDVGRSSNQVEYRGAGWSQTGNIHYHDGSSSDAAYIVRFFGVQATVTGGKNIDRGIAAFAVCDVNGDNCAAETLSDGYAPSLEVKQVLWTSPLLPLGEHAIRVRATQMRNSASMGTIIDFDRAIVD